MRNAAEKLLVLYVRTREDERGRRHRDETQNSWGSIIWPAQTREILRYEHLLVAS